jgi:hypothetical protein
VLDSVPHRVDHTRDLGAGGKRTRRLVLVEILNDQEIGIINAAGAHGDTNLPRTGDGFRDVVEHQGFGTAGVLAEQGFHEGISRW